MSEPTKFLLPEDAIPTHWVNIAPDLPGEPLPPLSPRTGEPAGPDDLTPIFPMGLIAQEVSQEPEIAIPDAVRDAYKLWRPTPLYRARRPVGLRARVRLHAVRARVRGLHGRLELRPEALPPLDDAGLGSERAPVAVGANRGRPFLVRAPDRLARHRDLRGRRGRRRGPRLQLLARLRPEPRAAAPDGDRAGGDRAARAGGRGDAGRDRRLRRRRLQLRRARLPVPARRRGRADRRGRAGRLPDADARGLLLRLRRHRRDDAADADVHARPRLRPAARARRRAALPRRRADGLRARAGRPDRGAGLPAERDVRGGRAVRAQRGHHPGAGTGARDPRGDRGGLGRRGEDDPVRALRPRPLRP